MHISAALLSVSPSGRITEALAAPLLAPLPLLGEPLEELLCSSVRAAWREVSGQGGQGALIDLPLSARGALLIGLPEGARLWGSWRPDEGGGGRLWAQPDLEGRWRRRLLSQRAGLRDLRHDLRSRLFLLSALPELSAHTPPAELLEDLLSDLPALTSFFEERAAPEWVSSPPLPPPPATAPEARAALRALVARLHARSPSLRCALLEEGERPSSPRAPSPLGAPLGDPLGAPLGALVGVFWALTRLEGALKEARRGARPSEPLAPRPSPAPLTLELDLIAPPAWALDLCGRPRPEGPLLLLTLRGGGAPWGEWARRAPPPAPLSEGGRFSPVHAGGLGPLTGDDPWAREAQEWMEAWWVAADLLGGGLCAPPEEGEGVSLYWPAAPP